MMLAPQLIGWQWNGYDRLPLWPQLHQPTSSHPNFQTMEQLGTQMFISSQPQQARTIVNQQPLTTQPVQRIKIREKVVQKANTANRNISTMYQAGQKAQESGSSVDQVPSTTPYNADYEITGEKGYDSKMLKGAGTIAHDLKVQIRRDIGQERRKALKRIQQY